MNPKPPKKVWKMLTNEAGKFYMVDQDGSIQYGPDKDQSRHKMFEYAIEHGADEVEHAYDCIKYP